MILLLLSACFGLDVMPPRGKVEYTCTFAYETDGDVEEGTWDEGAITCSKYQEDGEQLAESKVTACEEEGEDADEASCDCEFDVPDTCTGAVDD